MRTYFRFTLTLLVCAVGAFSLPATAQLLDATLPMQYIPLGTPCRAVDTRPSSGGAGPIAGGTFRNFSPGTSCGITAPSSGVIAYALNVTAVPHGTLGYLSVWPAGELQPVVSTLNSPDGQPKANAAIVTGGTGGQVSVFVSSTADVVLDVSGYFIAEVAVPSTYTFFPITPCRVVNTQLSNGTLGSPSLVANQERTFQLTLSSCDIQVPVEVGGAYSINVTVVPKNGKPVGFVKVWGTSASQPDPPATSTLNSTTGTVVANAAIVTVNPGTGGGISVISSDNADVIIDVNGYFAFSQLVQGGLSLYTLPPCRILNTEPSGEFSGERTIPVTTGNNCSVSGAAKAYVMNATVVPPAPLGFLTLWENGAPQPLASTLNAVDGQVTSNMAIIGTTNGSIDAFASSTTQLILDISAYFAP